MIIPALLVLSTLVSQEAPLKAQDPIVVAGGPGKFDFMNIDVENRIALACHPGKSSFTVIDLTAGTAMDVDCGTAVNGIAADSKGHRVFAAGPGKTLVSFDSKGWTKLGAQPLDGPGDCVQYDDKRGVVYVDNDDGTNLWTFTADALKLTGTVTIKEAPEYMEYDAKRDRVFQAIKSSSSVQVVDPASGTVAAEWTLGDLTSPHGLCLDSEAGRVYVAGKNSKLAILDADSGKLVNTATIVAGSDQIAFDKELKRLYIPGEGKIQIVQIDGDIARVIGSVPVNSDCHRGVVDPKTHDLWVAYSTKTGSFVQKFTSASMSR